MPNGDSLAPGSVLPVWKRKSDAFLFCSGDRRLPHGAVRLFFFLAERTFWLRMGGDTRGSIIVSRQQIAKTIGACPKNVSAWARKLEALGYIRTAKIFNPHGYPMNRYTVVPLEIAAGEQPELPLENAPLMISPPFWAQGGKGTPGKGVKAPLAGVVTTPLAGGQTPPLLKVRTVEQGEEEEAPLESWADWKQKIKRMYRGELKDLLGMLKNDLKRERENPANYKMTLTKSAKEFINYAQSQIDKGIKPGSYAKDIDRCKKSPDSYHREALTPSAAAVVANLTRKIRKVEEALR